MTITRSLAIVPCEKNFTHALIANMDKPMNNSVEEITVRIESKSYG